MSSRVSCPHRTFGWLWTGELSADDAPTSHLIQMTARAFERQWKYSQRVISETDIDFEPCFKTAGSATRNSVFWCSQADRSVAFMKRSTFCIVWTHWTTKYRNVFRPSTASQGSPLWSAHATLPKCTAMNATGELSADDAPVVAASRWQQFCSERQWKYSQRVIIDVLISIFEPCFKKLSATSKRFLMLPFWPERGFYDCSTFYIVWTHWTTKSQMYFGQAPPARGLSPTVKRSNVNVCPHVNMYDWRLANIKNRTLENVKPL